MKFSAGFLRKFHSFSLLLILISAVLVWQLSPRAESSAQTPEKPAELPNYDIRADESHEARATIGKFLTDAGKTESMIAAERKKFLRGEKDLLAGGAKLKIEYHGDLRAPETIAPDLSRSADFLTAPSSEKRAAILKNFLKRNSDLFGLEDAQIGELETTADYTNPDGNLSFVHFEQKIGGIPVFQGEVKAGFTRKNEIIRIVNKLAPNLVYESLSNDFGSAESAVEAAAKHIGWQTSESDTKRVAATSNDLKITFERGQFADATTAEKFYFPLDAGVARPAWRVLLWTGNEAFYVIVDARDGTLLWRKNIVEIQSRQATFGVYGNPTSMLKTADSPSAFTPGCMSPLNCPQPPVISRQIFTLIGNEPPYTFNNLGWIPDTGLTPPDDNVTDGNAVEAGIDRDGTNGVDAPVPGNPNRVFNFSYNPAPGNPPPGEGPLMPEFQKGSVTHAFYAVNRWHDEMYLLGFTEQAGNFQHFNFGRGGSEGDRVSAEIQDSSGTNGANMAVPADGGRPRLQMFIWTGGDPDRDGGLDSQVVIHEITHGVSSRLHGNSSGLTTNMSRGMGEGWSDFYALALMSEPTDDPLGTHTVGGYITYQLGGMESNYYYGIRRFPTAILASVGPNGRPHNPLTFKYLNANCDTFIGTTISNPNSAFPRNPVISISSGSQPCDQVHNAGEIWNVTLWEVRNQLIERHGAAEGNRRVLQYVTDGMKLSPIGPTMLQARDAIIAAAFASDPSDVLPVRRGFAIRGMGYYASIQNTGTGSNNTQVTESFEALGNVFIGTGFSVSDAPGDGDGYPEPGEALTLTVPLSNNTGATITGVTLQVVGGGSAFYGDIANGQTLSQNISFTVPASAPCGNYVLTFNINSSAGARTETRTIVLGAPVGGPPVSFSNTTPLTIPSVGASTPYGTAINVSGLSGNKKIKLEITGLTHTFPGDLDLLLVGPGGQKFIVMSDAVSSFATQTGAQVVLKDDAAAILPATGTTVNMNGEWRPTNHGANDAFPAPAPAAPYENPAPGGTATFASVFGSGGAAMNGTWTLYVVDDVSGDSGSIAGWKLTFESSDFLCCFCPLSRTPAISSPTANSAIPVCSCPPPGRGKDDFDGDGRTDISVFRPSEGNWYLNRSTAGFTVANWGLSGDRLAPGDFDGDGKTDVAVFRPDPDASQPDFYVLNSFSSTYSGYSWGLPGDIPVIEDYDGDNKSDIAVYRPSNHTFYVLRSSAGTVLTFSNIAFGTPVTGDFDGDGKGDFATYSFNGWYLSQSNVGYASVNFTRWGADGDKPVPADYDGDAKDDFAVFRPSDRTWYIRGSAGVNFFVQFGLADDVPVPGDYDGDGKTDVAVYRGGIWYINRSTTGMVITQFGLSNDLPVPNRYLP